MPPRIESITLLYSHSGMCASIRHELLPGGMQLAVSLILKERDNSPLGYLFKREGAWRACVKGNGTEATLVLFFKENIRREFAVLCGAGERNIGEFAGEVAGGYLMRHGDVLACCGKMTWEECEKDAAQQKKIEQECCEETKERMNGRIKELSSDNQGEYTGGSNLDCCLHRRWPPPPCMPDARYENGTWQESEGD